MTEVEILDQLWDAHHETPFASFSLQRKLDLRHDEVKDALSLISDMSETGEVRNGIRIKKVASTLYKLIQSTQDACDSPKGLPLTDPKETLTGANTAVFDDQPPENGENHAQDTEAEEFSPNIGCLLMPLRREIPVFRTAQDKADFDENHLWGWEYITDATPRDIIQYADAGRVFVPGQFVKCREKQRFRHTKATWQGTHMIACDADQIKEIEFDDDGNDKTPEGVEAFTYPKRLFELNPSLQGEAYAIGHSLSSLSKPPPHIRCRIYFVLEQQIREETDYKWLLLGLSTVYPIISASRQPAQPVYGNAGNRRIFKDGEVQSLPQPFRTRIFDDNRLSTERIRELIEIGKQAELDQAAAAQAERQNTRATDRRSDSTTDISVENQTTLDEWLTSNNIPIRGKRDRKYLFVDCPWDNQHTSDFGAKDTAVWEDDEFGFCFCCLHAHCTKRQWEDYRQAVAPKETYTPRTSEQRRMSRRYGRRYSFRRF